MWLFIITFPNSYKFILLWHMRFKIDIIKTFLEMGHV
jgi:hypothetical protein